MFDIGLPEIAIVLVIVLLIFGPGRLAKAMGELGSGLRSFKESLSPSIDEKKDDAAETSAKN